MFARSPGAVSRVFNSLRGLDIQVQGHCRLQFDFEVILDYVRPCLKNEKKSHTNPTSQQPKSKTKRQKSTNTRAGRVGALVHWWGKQQEGEASGPSLKELRLNQVCWLTFLFTVEAFRRPRQDSEVG